METPFSQATNGMHAHPSSSQITHRFPGRTEISSRDRTVDGCDAVAVMETAENRQPANCTSRRWASRRQPELASRRLHQQATMWSSSVVVGLTIGIASLREVQRTATADSSRRSHGLVLGRRHPSQDDQLLTQQQVLGREPRARVTAHRSGQPICDGPASASRAGGATFDISASRATCARSLHHRPSKCAKVDHPGCV